MTDKAKKGGQKPAAQPDATELMVAFMDMLKTQQQQRHEDDLRHREEEARRQEQELARRREEEARRQEQELARRQEEEARHREEETRRQEREDKRKREEEDRRCDWEKQMHTQQLKLVDLLVKQANNAKEPKMPRAKLHKFDEEKDDIEAFLEGFEATAESRAK